MDPRFFILSPIGSLMDPDLCILDDPPKGIGLRQYCLAMGDRAAPYYPKDPRIQFRPENPGIKLSSLLGSTLSYLTVSSALKETIATFCQDIEVEYLPFDLYDHKGRLYSRDYFIINPIGTRDCLDIEAAGLIRGPEGSIIKVRNYVVAPAKAASLPNLFRIQEDPMTYVIGAPLAEAIREKGFTNVLLKPMPLSQQL
ncbi:hypothetical protein HPC49_34240 [Pyxidicoccus fallax]|uniref:Immunity MXAN-0049 protein domain-containing protein n=1 Tax=Pyxidicoccus fallax TaxID=394095 RepID=A0A848LKV4_9BACT|nr:DUF1629 domain-containing protein [Pyxidicoccus fallax]NMO18351.1 hypothetical protein [Pyxidicoccus fallax]NPC83268.1 hypothetical protein [Pyxidicoccus fallax]